ncbi:MAG: metal ABC transporter permease [Verrucomicrobia bacterium]|nr:metal ABC transporter permease [Verrucomicrobiota bacterium]
MFEEPFMRRALLAAVLLGPLCGGLGVFVMARRMSFFSDTVSHGALTGIAVGLFFGLTDPTLPMLAFSLGIAGAILWLKQRTALLTDTIMAILMSGSMAAGILLITRQKTYVGDLHRYLFGDILMIDSRDLWLAGALGAGTFLWLWRQLSPLALLTAHEELAHVAGISVSRLNWGFTALMTLAVTMSIRLLGIVLVTSLLVIPAAAARNVSRNLRQHLLLAVGAGLAGGVGGTTLSYQFDLPCGPSIVMTCVALFLVSLPARNVVRSSA